MTTVSNVMTRSVRTLAPGDTLVQAAQAMKELNVGVIPVCEAGALVGMVTDRDIVVRGLALGLDSRTARLSEVMSADVRTVRDDADVDQILGDMARSQVRRLPVVDAQGGLVGIVSLGDIATRDSLDKAELANSLGEISAPATR
ncbi:MAG: CBS domain-containing protein [Ramlibacter sp.]